MLQTFNVTVNEGVTEEAEKVTLVTKDTVDDGPRKRNLDFDSTSVESEQRSYILFFNFLLFFSV